MNAVSSNDDMQLEDRVDGDRIASHGSWYGSIWLSPYALVFDVSSPSGSRSIAYLLGNTEPNRSGLPYGDGLIVGFGVSVPQDGGEDHDVRIRRILSAPSRSYALAGSIERYAPVDERGIVRLAFSDPLERRVVPVGLIASRPDRHLISERFIASMRTMGAYLCLRPDIERSLIGCTIERRCS